MLRDQQLACIISSVCGKGEQEDTSWKQALFGIEIGA